MRESDARCVSELIKSRLQATQLRFDGELVVTEAATGAYSSTAAAAAAAGGVVWAYATENDFGSSVDAINEVLGVSRLLGVASRVNFVERRSDLPFESADVVTNSGVLRPISATDLSRMKQGAAVALMYESWEARETDIDFDRAKEHGVEVIGVNERHPYCGAFEFLGSLAITALERRGWLDRAMNIGVLSDNAFKSSIVSSLKAVGCQVIELGPDRTHMCDVVVVATTPPSVEGGSSAGGVTNEVLRTQASACVVLWGDVDYPILKSAGVNIEPEGAPPPGHQGIGMHEAGFEPVVRLQVAGLAAVNHMNASRGHPAFGLAQRHVKGT